MEQNKNYYLDSVVEMIEKLRVQLKADSDIAMKQLQFNNRQREATNKLLKELLKEVKKRKLL